MQLGCLCCQVSRCHHENIQSHSCYFRFLRMKNLECLQPILNEVCLNIFSLWHQMIFFLLIYLLEYFLTILIKTTFSQIQNYWYFARVTISFPQFKMFILFIIIQFSKTKSLSELQMLNNPCQQGFFESFKSHYF